MKFLTFIFVFLILAVTVLADPAPTNSVKISALPSAGTLGGGELVPMVQGGITKQGTVGQIQVIPLTANTASSNALQASIIVVSNWSGTASNALQAQIILNMATNASLVAAVNAASNSLTTVSNSLNATVTALGTVSNALTVVSNTVNANSASIATLQGATNGMNTRIATLEAAGGGTNASAVSFNRISTPTFQMPSVASLAVSAQVTNINVDFNNGTFQKVFVSFVSGNGVVVFKPMNFRDGDNMFLEVILTNGISGNVGTSSTATNGTIDAWTSTTIANANGDYSQVSGSVREALLNWQVMGGSLIWTMAIHQ